MIWAREKQPEMWNLIPLFPGPKKEVYPAEPPISAIRTYSKKFIKCSAINSYFLP
jgi:hypothetical protein